MILIYIIVSFIALILLVALFVPRDYSVKQEIVINKPSVAIYNYFRYLQNQEAYAVWNGMDPEMKKTYSGTDGEPGFIYTWESKNKKVGQGEQEIKAVTDGESIETELRFIKPFEGRADAKISVFPLGENQSRVTWDLNSSMKYPMNFMLLFMNMDKMIGKDFETGLSNMKRLLETNQ
ncbi:MAG: polyketide cyclase [Flavobacterium sp. BFFFF1]|uniref:SRPBCC family protein n=1 Tax=Flavobacterium sp. BFFFF1 TaxID=2015557 RepID=UPI000BC52987|nr:SRPBCC family protein [Flavobacterium sp. BFFFF1]OYU80051.1 MAG: polyketide cyclase [Flavobacterium sp. BFFFF1]